AEIPFGTLTLTARVDDQEPLRRKSIFDPVPRVDGIDASGDPLTEVRSDVYLLSGRRRRAAGGKSIRRRKSRGRGGRGSRHASVVTATYIQEHDHVATKGPQ